MTTAMKEDTPALCMSIATSLYSAISFALLMVWHPTRPTGGISGQMYINCSSTRTMERLVTIGADYAVV